MTTTNEHTERAELIEALRAEAKSLRANAALFRLQPFPEGQLLQEKAAALLEAQPAREWVGLDSDEICDCFGDGGGSNEHGNIVLPSTQWLYDFASAVESKLREKNARLPAADDKAGGEPVAWQPTEKQCQEWLQRHGLHPADRDAFFDAAALYLQHTHPQPQADVRVPDGYVLVPVEPTPEMCRALFINLVHADEARVIKAVISAAPQPEDIPAIFKEQAS